MPERIGLESPRSATVIRTKYELQFCCKTTHIVQLLRQEDKTRV